MFLSYSLNFDLNAVICHSYLERDRAFVTNSNTYIWCLAIPSENKAVDNWTICDSVAVGKTILIQQISVGLITQLLSYHLVLKFGITSSGFSSCVLVSQ